ncbi:MAG: ABC transporter permease [Acidobacteria bacterium]|nr:ABC transporter permease [Acidobacteriota bacterium]
MWKRVWSRRKFEEKMQEELRFHIEEYTADLIRSGIPAEEAARRARVEFGSAASVQEECRQARGLLFFDELKRQIRHASRLLRKSPGFTMTAILTLGVCIGANLTLFAVVDAILLRPLPFPEPERLVTIFNTYPKANVERDGSSITNYYERRGRIAAFASLSMYRQGSGIVGEPGYTEREIINRVTPEFFGTLGTRPVLGRVFTEEETTPATDKAVILTDGYWRERFNADPNIAGRRVRIDGIANTVVGVLPAGFRFLSSEARLYAPFSSSPEERTSGNRHSGGNAKHLIARMAPGATIEQAQSQIDAQNAALDRDNPRAAMMAEAGFRSLVVSLHGDHTAGVRTILLCLQAGALGLLIIGGVNLMNLLLIRASSRAKEIAVRQALGATWWHVIAESGTEIVALAFAGGILGIAIGAFGVQAVIRFGADRLPLGSQIGMNAQLVVATIAGSSLLGVLMTIPIAWFHLRNHAAIQTESRSTTAGRAAQRLRHAFITGQIALALVLLTGAGLLGLSLEKAMAVPPGFRADHVLTGQLSVSWNVYRNWPSRLGFNERLLNELRGQPGVVSAGIASNVPLSGNSGKSAATVIGYARRPGESPRGLYSYGVDGDYFAAMGFALREGRFLNAADTRGKVPVCVVDEDFARYYWAGKTAIGQQLFQGASAGREQDAFTVVGVVGAVKQSELTDEAPHGAVYYPYVMRSDPSVIVAIRSQQPPESLVPALQRAVRQIDPEVPITGIRTMEARIDQSLVTRRSPALLAGLFSVVALLLTALGTYGVLSYAVAQRRREIGVRVALGARPESIRAQFLSIALRLLAAGTVLGLFGAWLTGQAMRTILFHVPPFHLATLLAAALTIGAVSLAACLIPSSRAARISPMEALADD